MLPELVVLATIFTCPRSLSSLLQGKGSTKELGKLSNSVICSSDVQTSSGLYIQT